MAVFINLSIMVIAILLIKALFDTPKTEHLMAGVIILDFISIILGMPAYLGFAVMVAFSDISLSTEILAVGWIGAFMAIIGGLLHIYSDEPMKWWSGLIASLGTIVCFPVLGIPALFFVLKDRMNRL